jgi:ElaB/YqjD/DUF883 family membrane-anchored ribosome-binding protein
MNERTNEITAEPMAEQNQQPARALTDATKRISKRAAVATDEYVHENPWTAIGVAAAVGLLVGVLLGQRGQ